MAAGVPIYVALFGRDTLTAAWQAALLGPEMMRGTLEVLARFQGRETNDWRDEQPGRMLHEAHTGPLAALDFHPRRRYYGSAHDLRLLPGHRLGAVALDRRRRPRPALRRPALDALAWLDRYSDGDGDGFYEYRTRSSQGVTNQGWKDSGDAIVYEDGRLVTAPIATCEEQAFVYAAKLHLSEVLWWLKEKDEARRLYHEASELKKRFNDAFWMEDEGFFAMGLDAQGGLDPLGRLEPRPLRGRRDRGDGAGRADRAAADGAGPVQRLGRADALVEPSGLQPVQLPPGLGLAGRARQLRAGLPALRAPRAPRGVVPGMFEAARLFDFYRLPEVFSGHGRDADHPFPALYPQTNSPQAWSASAVFCPAPVHAGALPLRAAQRAVGRPPAPDWLPEITLRNLRVGSAVVTLRFSREGDRQHVRGAGTARAAARHPPAKPVVADRRLRGAAEGRAFQPAAWCLNERT